MNTFSSFLKRFAAFVTVVITVLLTVSCTVVSPPQQGRGQMMPQQWHPNMGPYGPGAPQMMPQGGPYGPQQGYHPQMTGIAAGQLQPPYGRLNVTPGAGRRFDGKLDGATGVVTWTLNGTFVKGSSVPLAARQGFEQELKNKGYPLPVIHKE